MSTRVTDIDGDTLHVLPRNYAYRPDIVASIPEDDRDFDREGAVALIEALTSAVEAADTRKAAEARKLKRGDLVRSGTYAEYTYAVISDEDEDGKVSVVATGPNAGTIYDNETAAYFVRP